MPAKRSWAEVVRLWNEGYRFSQIAKIVRISRTSITQHQALGDLVLPPRPWVTPGEAGINSKRAAVWVKRGLLKRSPGGFYDRRELERVARELAQRTCAYDGCQNVLPGRNPRQIFCTEHANRRLDHDARVLDAIRGVPGIPLFALYMRTRSTSKWLRPRLEEWERQGLIRSERTGRGGLRYWLTDQEQKSA